MQYLVFILLSPLAIVLPLYTVFVSSRYQKQEKAFTLILLMLAISGWTVMNTLELIAVSNYWTYIWAVLSYPFIMCAAPLWFLFALSYSGKKLSPVYVALLFFIPLIVIILVATNQLHSLFWKDITYFSYFRINAMVVEHGPLYWIAFIYQYLAMLGGVFLIFREYMTSYYRQKPRSILLVLGTTAPLTLHLIYITSVFPNFTKDYTSLSLALASVLFALGLNRFRLFDVHPFARHLLINQIRDSIFIINNHLQIVDVNGPANAMMTDSKSHLGRPITDIIPLFSTETALQEFIYNRNGQKIYFEIQTNPVSNNQKHLKGFVLVLRDQTSARMIQIENQALIKKQKSILKKVEHLSGFLPVCSSCRRIKNNEGNWKQVDAYIRESSTAEVSHSICPSCAAKLYPNLFPIPPQKEEKS